MLYFIQKGCSSSDTQDKKSLLRFQFEENDTILWYFCKRRLQAWCLFPWLRNGLPSEPDTAVLYERFWAKIHRVYDDISWTASRTSFGGKRSYMVSVSFIHFMCVLVFVLCPWNAFNSVLKIYHSSRQSATSPSSPTYFLLRVERNSLRPVIGIEIVRHPVSHQIQK